MSKYVILYLGPSKCSWGKHEWCASRSNAKRCHVRFKKKTLK